jgi:hypothetical protein
MFIGDCHSWASRGATFSSFSSSRLVPDRIRQQGREKGIARIGFLLALGFRGTVFGDHSTYR